jgi:hypothetical protein
MDSKKRLSLAWRELKEIHTSIGEKFGAQCLELDLSHNELKYDNSLWDN